VKRLKQNIYAKEVLIFVLLLVSYTHLFCQPQDSLTHKQKTIRKGILIGASGIYTATSLSYLNFIWYKPYAASNFHFFNDNAEWCQMDKMGHTFTTYNSAREMYRVMRWAGYTRNQSIFIGEAFGALYMTTVEIMDGYSSAWGFSWGDEAANISGSLLFTLQQYFWDEQRVHLKYSFHQTSFAQKRPSELGSGLLEETIKDYNGQTYWLSINIASFLKKETKFPKWLNVAFGYGATNMISGRSNEIINPDKSISFGDPGSQTSEIINSDGHIDYFTRYRKYYFSFDIDFTKIKTKSKLLQNIFSVVNGFKIPFSAIEFDKHGLEFKPFYF
jgi:hypothetical protein